ncbi:MAG: helix-turn-helix domain-containing protein [Acidobacteria bacterium]|nr:helix-turn-helix domain-containing protein [Acidobacteriota bacterium]
MNLVISRHTPVADLPELLSVEEAATWLGIGRSLAYDLVGRGDLASVRLGRLLRVPRAALAAMVEQTQAVSA